MCVCLAQVRKTSQAALLVLLEQELIDRGDVESLVCPVLVDLTAPDSNDDVKTEAMAVSVFTCFTKHSCVHQSELSDG